MREYEAPARAAFLVIQALGVGKRSAKALAKTVPGATSRAGTPSGSSKTGTRRPHARKRVHVANPHRRVGSPRAARRASASKSLVSSLSVRKRTKLRSISHRRGRRARVRSG